MRTSRKFTAQSNRLPVARLKSSTTRGTNAAGAKPGQPRVRDHPLPAFVRSPLADIRTVPEDSLASLQFCLWLDSRPDESPIQSLRLACCTPSDSLQSVLFLRAGRDRHRPP